MNKATIVCGCLTVGVTLPIWLYLVYRILVAVQATELMMFLFWIYLPTTLFAHVLSSIIVGLKK